MIFTTPEGEAGKILQEFERQYFDISTEMIIEADLPEDWTEITPREVRDRIKYERSREYMAKLQTVAVKEAAFLDKIDRERYEQATGGDAAKILADAKEQAAEGIIYTYARALIVIEEADILKTRQSTTPLIYHVKDFKEQPFFVDYKPFMDVARKLGSEKSPIPFLLEVNALAAYIVNKVINMHVHDLRGTGELFKLEAAIGRILEKSQYTAGKLPAGWLADLLPQPLALPGFSNILTGPALNYMNEVLIYGGDMEALAKRKQATSHSATKARALANGEKAQIIFQNANNNITVGINDIEKLSGNNQGTKKIFAFTLSKINEQALNNGILTRDYITFSLQELIDKGIYKTRGAARNGFNRAMDILTSMKIKGTITRGKKESRIDAVAVLFTTARISSRGGQCIVNLNYMLDWEFIAQYFTFLPDYYYRLSNRAADLLFYIFYLARQNTDKIRDKGKFSISFRALQARLNLPDETGLNNPQRDIKDAIENAIDEIEEAHSATFNNTEFALLPVCSHTGPIKEYLDNGYLEIGFSGKYAEDFISFSEAASEKMESQRKRRERIQDRAAAIHEAKKLEAQEKAQQVQ